MSGNAGECLAEEGGLFRQGAEPGGESSEQFARYVRAEVEKWGKVVRANNIVLD